MIENFGIVDEDDLSLDLSFDDQNFPIEVYEDPNYATTMRILATQSVEADYLIDDLLDEGDYPDNYGLCLS